MRRGVKQGSRQRSTGMTIKHGVMNLEVIGPLATGQAVEHVHHPQWPGAVQQISMQVAHHHFKLLAQAGCRDADAFNMLIHVHLALHPYRIRHLQRQARQPPAQQRHHALRQQGLDIAKKSPW